MLTFYLILGHLIADFVLQPEKLVKWKHKSWVGTLVHGGVHGAVTLALFAPFLLARWGGEAAPWLIFLAIFGISALHVLIDTVKIWFERRSKRHLVLFMGDQAAHLMVLLGAGLWLAVSGIGFEGKRGLDGFLYWYSHPSVIMGLCLLLTVSYAYELMLFQRRREGNAKAQFVPNYRGMVRRTVIAGGLYALVLLFGVYGTAAFG